MQERLHGFRSKPQPFRVRRRDGCSRATAPPGPRALRRAPRRAQASGGAAARRRARDRVPRRLEGLRGRRGRPRPRDLRDRAGRVRVSGRPHRLGEVDRHAPADPRAGGLAGHGARGRTRRARDPAAAGALLPAQHRGRVAGLQAAPEPHGARQRRLRTPGHRRQSPRDPRQGARHPAPDRALDEAPQLSRPALGRRAAARLDRARVRQPPADAAVRRADREPRPRDEHRDHAAALPDQPHGHDGAGRDPRPRDGRQDAPPGDRAGRGPDRARRGGRAVHRRRVDAGVRGPHARRGRRPGLRLDRVAAAHARERERVRDAERDPTD